MQQKGACRPYRSDRDPKAWYSDLCLDIAPGQCGSQLAELWIQASNTDSVDHSEITGGITVTWDCKSNWSAVVRVQ